VNSSDSTQLQGIMCHMAELKHMLGLVGAAPLLGAGELACLNQLRCLTCSDSATTAQAAAVEKTKFRTVISPGSRRIYVKQMLSTGHSSTALDRCSGLPGADGAHVQDAYPMVTQQQQK
jgi:hypothetical protein